MAELLSIVAQQYGERPALAIKPGFRNRVTTFAELERHALRVGRYLRERGVGKGDRVLICAPNMPEWVIAYFGCHKVGAVPVPLDVRSASEFVAGIAEATEAKLAVLSRPTAGFSEAVNAPWRPLEGLQAELPADGLADPAIVEPDDIAEIMFTSGTTGDPKGVVLTHRNILFNVWAGTRVTPPERGRRLLSLLPLSHMLEQTAGLLVPLSQGAMIVYPVSRQPGVLFRTLAEHRITMLVLVPQALQLFLNAIEREARQQGREAALQRAFALAERLPTGLRRLLFSSVHRRMGGGLRIVICGGAYLDPALARRWELMGVTLLQGYGATEAAPIITCDWPHRRRIGAVGMPLPGVEVKVADDGEVLARGANIFQGYWRNPAATAQALQDGWYHTGDLGQMDADGFLHLRGRKKDLIVLANGQNVFPEDIEAELSHHPAVADCAVVGLEQDGGDVQVHAALLMRDPVEAADAVRWVNERLADHQRILAYTVWPEQDFPRTHTLKVKKREVLDELKRLQASAAAPPAAPSAAPPASPLHRLIAELASVAPDRITSGSTLGGDLGLDSLGRVELLSAIEGELGAYIDESSVSPNTTVQELERLVSESGQRRHASSMATWPLHPAAGIAREALLQLVFFPAYHLFWRFRVRGRERLAGVKGPVLIAANHHFGVGSVGFDPAAVWMGLPRRLRLRTCTMGEEHAVFDNPVKGFLARMVNTFPLSKEGNVRASLECVGRLLDDGWSVLIFPEGKLTPGGPLQPLMGGTGLLAVEAGTPVVPVFVDVERNGILQGSGWPWRGAFTVHLGDPLVFPPGTTYSEATTQLEAAIRSLDPSLGGPSAGEREITPRRTVPL
jgi:long-chain acyl-CoA synthetase